MPKSKRCVKWRVSRALIWHNIARCGPSLNLPYTFFTKPQKLQLTRGAKLVEVLKQGQYSPRPVEEQVAILWTAGQGYLDDVEDSDIARFQAEYVKYVRSVGAPDSKAFAPRRQLMTT